MRVFLVAVLLSVLASVRAETAEPNLLRNGSFEGGLLYWHNIEPDAHRLANDAKNGSFALRIERGFVMSAPFVAEQGQDYTVSLWVKADRPGTLGVQMPPSAREVGTAHHRLWTGEATQEVAVGPNWQRVSFTWPANVPNDGFWPQQHYMLSIGAGDTTPILIDGVTVLRGRQGTRDYEPRSSLEVLVDCPDLPGFQNASGNCFPAGSKPRIVAHLSNPSSERRAAILRWQLFDYEGQIAVSEPIDEAVTIEPAGTIHRTRQIPLTHRGCVLARASIIVDNQTLDQSEIPLTTLPYPAAAARPDWRERFGGSFAGGVRCAEKLQPVGFGWIRWRPLISGDYTLPTAPKPGQPWQFTWFDHELDEQEKLGFCSHLVLYPPPKWIMEPGNPLPTDMRWAADDPRWQDLTVETTWDKFVRAAVEHYGRRSVVFELENEPEFSGWTEAKLLDEYAQFTRRTARLVKQTAPQAKVMINNVYGIPNALNGRLFQLPGALEPVDIISWHDYHAGWLTDAKAIRRMRQNIDDAGGSHVQIWFNEGWAFTNTAVDEPIACTGLTSAQSTNAIMASVAETSVAGQKKTVMFHLLSENHGMSFWDYSGPGTMIWDWYNYPLPLLAAWNVMNHHLGISDEAGLVRPPGANLAIFQDLRNDRGVVVAYADRDSSRDATVALPDSLSGLTTEDIMGNPQPMVGQKLTLSRTGRIVYLYGGKNLTAAKLLQALGPLDRKLAGFVAGADELPTFRLPDTWEGNQVGSAAGNPITAQGKAIWRLDQLLPKADPKLPASYVPLLWSGTNWYGKQGFHGGQPSIDVANGGLDLGMAGPWPGADVDHEKTAALVFIAPADGRYRFHASAQVKRWTGGAASFPVHILKKDAQRVVEIQGFDVSNEAAPLPLDFEIDLRVGHELLLLPSNPHANNGAHCLLTEVLAERIE